MSEWQKVKLGDVCEITSSKRIFFSEYVESGIPFYRSKEIIEKGKGEEISQPLYISEEKYDEIKGKYGVPQKGDLLLTAVGSLGIPFVVKDNSPFYFKDGNLVWLKHFQDINPFFLYYWIKSEKGYNALYNIAIGSAQKALTIAAIKSLEIPLPSLTTQHRIATILSRYDSLIENYQKQIKLLEEAAQRLYKEWFFDLHFPGHENTNIIDGVPEGWENTNVNGIVTFHRGYDLTHSEMIDGKYPVIGSTSIIGTHKDYKINGPGIVTGRSGSLGKFQLIQSDFWPHNTTLYISDFKGHDVYYIYCMLSRLDFASLNNGGAIPTLNRNVLSNISVLEPDSKVQKEFTKIVTPMFIKREHLQSQLRLLTEARDRLLPKLMSGAIEV